MSILRLLLKSTWRTALRHKQYAFTSLLGLVLALSACFLVLPYALTETSYDEHIENSDRIFRIYNVRYGDDGPPSPFTVVPAVYRQRIQDEFPQITQSARLLNDYNGSVFVSGEKVFSEENGFFAERPMLDFLDISLVSGNPGGFDEPGQMILSESLYRKIFSTDIYKDTTVQVKGFEAKVTGTCPKTRTSNRITYIPWKRPLQTLPASVWKTGYGSSSLPI